MPGLEQYVVALRCPRGSGGGCTLSGGERRRVPCALLLQQPAPVLLDESTNHLDAESIDWLEHTFATVCRNGNLITTTVISIMAGWILELDQGEGIPWKGNYSSWLEQKTQRMALEEKQASKDAARHWNMN